MHCPIQRSQQPAGPASAASRGIPQAGAAARFEPRPTHPERSRRTLLPPTTYAPQAGARPHTSTHTAHTPAPRTRTQGRSRAGYPRRTSAGHAGVHERRMSTRNGSQRAHPPTHATQIHSPPSAAQRTMRRSTTHHHQQPQHASSGANGAGSQIMKPWLTACIHTSRARPHVAPRGLEEKEVGVTGRSRNRRPLPPRPSSAPCLPALIGAWTTVEGAS